MRPTAALIVLLLALAFAACGGDDDGESGGSADETPTTDAAAAGETDAGAEPTKPEVEVPGGKPPKELAITDITEGVAGMKVGGRRQLVIPPDMAYGRQGAGPIGPKRDPRLRRRPARSSVASGRSPGLSTKSRDRRVR